MGEWFIPAVLKTAVLRGTGGSNPSLSATIGCLTNCQAAYYVDYKFWNENSFNVYNVGTRCATSLHFSRRPRANAPAWVFVCKNTFFYSIFQRKIKKIFYPKQTPQAKQRARVTSIWVLEQPERHSPSTTFDTLSLVVTIFVVSLQIGLATITKHRTYPKTNTNKFASKKNAIMAAQNKLFQRLIWLIDTI